jgi:MarR family transcriptional regulator, transcriptional regulator for hemolysin
MMKRRPSLGAGYQVRQSKRPEESIDLLPVDAARLLRRQIDRALERAGLGLTAGEARTLA